MDGAAAALEPVLAETAFRDVAVPVVANDDAEAHTDGDGWRGRSAAHVTRPVRWREVQLTLGDLGATTLLEIGHGSMLAALAKRTLPDATVTGVATPEDVATVAAAT
jgi:[acyl-carrier-protein] S-malonyltransferase